MMEYSAKRWTDEELPFLEDSPFVRMGVANDELSQLPVRIQKPTTPADLRSVFYGIRAAQRYQNEYQTALDRYVPQRTVTHGFLENFKKNTAKYQQKRPIPTLASNSQTACQQLFGVLLGSDFQ